MGKLMPKSAFGGKKAPPFGKPKEGSAAEERAESPAKRKAEKKAGY